MNSPSETLRDEYKDIIVGGTMQKITLKPRWYYWWSPKAWRNAKLATIVSHHQGKKLAVDTVRQILEGK